MPIRIGVDERENIIQFAVQSSLTENCPNKVNLIKNLDRNRIEFEDRGLVIWVPISAFKNIDKFEILAFEGFTEGEYNPANPNPEGNDGKFAYIKQITAEDTEQNAPILGRMVIARGEERKAIQALRATLLVSSKDILAKYFEAQAGHTARGLGAGGTSS